MTPVFFRLKQNGEKPVLGWTDDFLLFFAPRPYDFEIFWLFNIAMEAMAHRNRWFSQL